MDRISEMITVKSILEVISKGVSWKLITIKRLKLEIKKSNECCSLYIQFMDYPNQIQEQSNYGGCLELETYHTVD